MAIQSRWESDPAIAYLAKPSDGKAHYWRVGDVRPVRRHRPGTRPIAIGQSGSSRASRSSAARRAKASSSRRRDPITVDFTAVQPSGDAVLSPEAPYIDRRSGRERDAEGGGRSVPDGRPSPTACARATRYIGRRRSCARINADEGLNQARSNAHQRRVPVLHRAYGDIRRGSIGQVTKDVAKEILDSIPPDQQTHFASPRRRRTTCATRARASSTRPT